MKESSGPYPAERLRIEIKTIGLNRVVKRGEKGTCNFHPIRQKYVGAAVHHDNQTI